MDSWVNGLIDSWVVGWCRAGWMPGTRKQGLHHSWHDQALSSDRADGAKWF